MGAGEGKATSSFYLLCCCSCFGEGVGNGLASAFVKTRALKDRNKMRCRNMQEAVLLKLSMFLLYGEYDEQSQKGLGLY